MKCYLQLILFCCAGTIFISCSKQDQHKPQDPPPATHKDVVISYFKEIALGYEFGNASAVTRKWKMSMKVFTGGEKDSALLGELDKIIAEINSLVTDGFNIQLTTDSIHSNYYLFLGADSVYAKLFPDIADLLPSNYGLFTTNFNANDEIISGHMYVDLYRTIDPAAKKHLLREELTQSLGLAKDSEKYPESIFQQKWTTVTAYTDIDKELIKALYDPRMLTGLNAVTADPVLRGIVQ